MSDGIKLNMIMMEKVKFCYINDVNDDDDDDGVCIMTLSCNMIVDRKDHVQYLTVSKSYSDYRTCSLNE